MFVKNRTLMQGGRTNLGMYRPIFGICSNQRLTSLRNWLKTQSRLPDVIAIQDPPLHLAFFPVSLYNTWFRGDNGSGDRVAITGEDSPYYRLYSPPYPNAHEKRALFDERKRIEEAKQKLDNQPEGCKQLAKVAFLVHQSIEEWAVSEPPTLPNRGLVASLHIKIGPGELVVHNFYNHNHPNGRLDIADLIDPCGDERKAHVVVGDSNLQHPLWSRNCNEKYISRKAKSLAEAMKAKEMVCKNDGSITYARGRRSSCEYASSIDIIFVSGFLADQSWYNVLNVPGYESDHAITSVTISMDLRRKSGIRFLWKEADRSRYNDFVASRIRMLTLPPNPNEADLNRTLGTFRDIIHEAMLRHVTIRDIFQHHPIRPSSIKNSEDYRNRVERESKSKSGVHRLAKNVSNHGKPRPLKHTPDFEPTPEYSEKVRCFVGSIWPLYSASPETRVSVLRQYSFDNWRYHLLTRTQASLNNNNTSSTNTNYWPLPLPLLDPAREQYDSDQQEEVARLLKDASDHKSPGVDGIPYEALKICACLNLRLHPTSFKDCITKPGKDPSLPKSYRPIALLNSLAKLLERIIADRFKQVEGMLPFTQFGAPGRSTTLALELLTTQIYTGWTKKIQGKLLGRLISLGIPDWLVEITWSFLSDRRTYIHLPGYNGDEYYIDVGVPQGSPLSSLLFLFYAAPLLDEFAKNYTSANLFSFVDDTYILLSTKSYEENVAKMGVIHDRLYKWADQNGMRFSPSKYHIMHFSRSGQGNKDEDCKLLPNMIGFQSLGKEEKESILQPTMTILGVVFDRRLTWEAHVNYIAEKRLKNYQSLFRSTWGIPLEQRRDLYHQHLIPIITYACPAWFLDDPIQEESHEKLRYCIPKETMKRLKSLQIEILIQLSKAWRRTPAELLQNEMHILPISLKLHAVAMNHRCRKLGSKEYEFMRRMRILARGEGSNHPHTQMSRLANDYKRQIFKNKAAYYHEAECDTEFGEHTLKLYHGLNTLQQTMLLGMRTGNIGVKANPVFRYHQKNMDMSCPHCGYIPHTIKHMLCACPALNRVRTHLTAAAGHNDFDTFMNRDTELATSWAIAYMGLTQFDSVKKDQYMFPREQKIKCKGT
ncbi:LOW QUALITY PROTEIN: reverse transcriptase (RNA-dependent DNA polymerase)-domain-containing protein [Bipolaris maydis]|nr:LOW QUALITY PROTEIN: reverse transcriptase (RNA-dependent DNA polymerase)-domain-containing protein [Bipolaris maydis]